jgi:hypothetical protein
MALTRSVIGQSSSHFVQRHPEAICQRFDSNNNSPTQADARDLAAADELGGGRAADTRGSRPPARP